jgi:hypothetical protein
MPRIVRGKTIATDETVSRVLRQCSERDDELMGPGQLA